MSDHPILFSGPMVRALLAGTKTQTRRVLLKLRRFGKFTEFGPSTTNGYDWHFRDKELLWHDLRHADLLQYLPYAIGDQLYVRETWGDVNLMGAPGIAFKADGDTIDMMEREDFLCPVESFNYEDERLTGWGKNGLDWSTWYADLHSGDDECARWRSPLHMPRWASRLTLTVTDVRVQRVQEISREDAIAEGLRLASNHIEEFWRWPEPLHERLWLSPIAAYRDLWDSLNNNPPKRPYGWDVNPWVGVTSFTVQRGNIDQLSKDTSHGGGRVPRGSEADGGNVK